MRLSMALYTKYEVRWFLCPSLESNIDIIMLFCSASVSQKTSLVSSISVEKLSVTGLIVHDN